MSMHKAWPNARLSNYSRLCSDVKQYNKACGNFVESMRSTVPNHIWLDTSEQPRPPAPPSESSTWLVIPFHTSLKACKFPAVLREVAEIGKSFNLGRYVPTVACSRLKSNIVEHVSAHF